MTPNLEERGNGLARFFAQYVKLLMAACVARGEILIDYLSCNQGLSVDVSRSALGFWKFRALMGRGKKLMNIDDLIKTQTEQWRRERSDTQLTLGELIAQLNVTPPDTQLYGLTEPHSYRGYYSDLAFESTGGTIRAAELLAMCQSALGSTFEGYKGGDFMMTKSTPLWVAGYGSCGEKIISINQDGTIETAEDEY